EVIRGLRQLTDAADAGNAEEAHRVMARLLTTDLPALENTLKHRQQITPRVSANPPKPFAMRLRPGVDQMVFEGLQRYTAVRAPVLAIFALKGMSDAAE